MKHLEEQDLILHYYGDPSAGAGAGSHLEECAVCREAFHSLCRVLDAFDELPVPERDANYGTDVWRRVRPFCEAPSRRSWWEMFQAQRWAAAGAVAMLMLVAFLAGRFTRTPQPPPTVMTLAGVSISEQVRERILLVAVGEHLERSQMVLVELVNAQPGDRLDISGERRRAKDLVNESRLYRQTAVNSGDAQVAGVLEELERVLLEVAHSPARISGAELDSLRRRIEDEGILFKMRVVESTIRGRENTEVTKEVL